MSCLLYYQLYTSASAANFLFYKLLEREAMVFKLFTTIIPLQESSKKPGKTGLNPHAPDFFIGLYWITKGICVLRSQLPRRSLLVLARKRQEARSSTDPGSQTNWPHLGSNVGRF